LLDLSHPYSQVGNALWLLRKKIAHSLARSFSVLADSFPELSAADGLERDGHLS
jgi:hypothetical protein